MRGPLHGFEGLDEALRGQAPPRPAAPRVPPPAVPPRGAAASPPVPPVRRRPKRSVTVGLDFGTRFTKVCYQVDDEGRIAVLPIGSGPDPTLRLSHLFVARGTGVVSTRGSPDGFEVPYLKMRLKDPDAAHFRPSPCIEHHVGAGTEAPLAALYLSAVLRRVRFSIAEREAARFEGADVIWEVNLSVPAQYQDAGVSDRFREVGEVALRWSEEDERSSGTVEDLCRRFAADARGALDRRRVEVFPEIVAALHPFIGRRDTMEGVHGFLDIGGGTLDGCIFRLRRSAAGLDLTVLAARVAPLGTVALAQKAVAELYRNLGTTIEERIVAAPGDGLTVALPLAGGKKDIEGLAGEARKRCPNHVLRQPATDYEADPTRIRPRDSFVLQCSGGGSGSDWYRRTFEGAHLARGLAAKGVMPYSLRTVETPKDVSGEAGGRFPRFVVAHGLAAPRADLEQIRCRLPREVETGVLPRQRSAAAPDYLSSKELT